MPMRPNMPHIRAFVAVPFFAFCHECTNKPRRAYAMVRTAKNARLLIYAGLLLKAGNGFEKQVGFVLFLQPAITKFDK